MMAAHQPTILLRPSFEKRSSKHTTRFTKALIQTVRQKVDTTDRTSRVAQDMKKYLFF